MSRVVVALTMLTAVQGSALSSRPRIVSLVPAVTEILFAIGAGPDVVGVSLFDRFPPEAATRPSVGGLLDPNVERILSLRPTVVVVYDTQEDLKAQLGRTGIRCVPYHHGSIADIFETIRELGAVANRRAEADRTIGQMKVQIASIAARVRRYPRISTLFVVGRPPGDLRQIYVAGGEGFLNEMVDLAGGVNVMQDIHRPAVEVSVETVVARQPNAIVESWPERLMDDRTRAAEIALWSRLGGVPAVRNHRVFEITDDRLAVPGPRLPEGIRLLAKALHPDVD